MTTNTAYTKTVAKMIGKSIGDRASMAHFPMPSRAKMYSVKIVPASKAAKSRPKIVMIGTIAARSACPKTTLLEDTPFAVAVRT